MRAKKLPGIKEKFYYEAPVLPAQFKAGKPVVAEKINSIDLVRLLLPSKENYYMVQVSGESMIEENIYDGDILIVEKNNQPKDGDIVIASLNGEMLVKIFRLINGKVYLFSANKRFIPIEIFPDWQFEILGVVRHCIHNMV
ncbi:MAG: S24 family peptidase [Bacteroidota bacterium]